MWLGGIQHNAEWRGCDDSASYVLHLQDSEKVSNKLRGTAPPTLNLACFVLYLKIINTILKINVFIL